MSAAAPLADDAARRLARERFDVPVLLEAGAGTGKTRALVERLLAWLLDAGWREAEERLASRARERGADPPSADAIASDLLDGVVAITFTDAAAAEMAARLAGALEAAAAGRTPADGAEVVAATGPEAAALRASLLVDRLGRARIQTIHAFARGLLASHPFEAGLHPSFRVDADERELLRLATETLADQLEARLAGAGDADLLAALDEGIDPDGLLEAVLEAARAGVAPTLFDDEPFPDDAVVAALQAAATAGETLLTVLRPVVPGLPANQTRARELAEELAALVSTVEAPGEPRARLEAAARSVDEFLAAHGETLDSWCDGESIATLEKRRGDGGPPLPDLARAARRAIAALAGASPARLAVRRRLVGPALAATRERMRREGFVLFGDLLDRAAALLEGHPAVRDEVRRGLRQLLVDEFQDTDARQCRLVESLALAPEGSSRPGLFVVGDPKQSIYAWRGADLAAYERFLARADAAGAVRARLSVNFRSIPALLAEVERTIAPRMIAEPFLQPAFEPLTPAPRSVARGETLRERTAVEYWSSANEAGARTPLGVANRLEGRAAARDIRRQRALDPELRWSDFALLLRATGDFETYLGALREAGVPFAVERDRTYWQRREVIDATAAVRAVLEPGDHLALVAFLRSPFVGVPDAAWLPLWEAGFPARVDALAGPDPDRLGELADLLARVARSVDDSVPGLDRIAGWETSAHLALEALAELRDAFGRIPAVDWVERLRSRLAPETTAAARFLGRFGVANLERFFSELAEALEDGGDDPAAVLRALRRAVGERRDAEEARPAELDGDAVRVMTIHKAKGLEFRHVYLLQLHKGQGGADTEAFAHEPGGGGRPAAYRLLGARTLAWTDAEEGRREVAERERVRLFYVAMTRARERLVLAGQLHSSRSRGSFLPLLDERRADSPAAAAPPIAPTRDSHGALWRTPALESETNEFPASAGAATPPADDSDLDGTLVRLAARRAEASARSVRARIARATDAIESPEPGADDEPERDVGGAEADRARRRGLVLHRALELAPLAVREPGRWRDLARRAWGAGAESEPGALDAVLDRLLASSLWRRLEELAPAVVARELPILLRASPDEGADAPLEGIVGTLDLLYVDPESGERVIADFKSDQATEPLQGEERARRYAAQLRLYGRAVRGGGGPERDPRLEIWWLDADRIEVVG